jgi:hypothetical protein
MFKDVPVSTEHDLFRYSGRRNNTPPRKGDIMRYLCLAYEEESTLNALSRNEWDALRTDTLAYVEELRKSGTLISAEPLQSVQSASTVRVRNGRLSITDGPFSETKETLGGFFLINAKDLNEAIRVASKWPSARLGSIEVRPIEEGLRDEGRYLQTSPGDTEG